LGTSTASLVSALELSTCSAGNFDRATAHAARAMEYRRTCFGAIDQAVVAGAVRAAMLPRAIAAAASIGRRPNAPVSSPTTASGSVGFTVVNGLQSPCGDEISSGEQGTVFRHASRQGRVVKIFKNELKDAMQEIDKHAALNEIKRLTGGTFRSLNGLPPTASLRSYYGLEGHLS
jgi:hypothetical protein